MEVKLLYLKQLVHLGSKTRTTRTAFLCNWIVYDAKRSLHKVFHIIDRCTSQISKRHLINYNLDIISFPKAVVVLQLLIELNLILESRAATTIDLDA